MNKDRNSSQVKRKLHWDTKRSTLLGVTAALLIALPVQGAPCDGDSERPPISGNGRYVGFSSAATTLVAGDTNGVDDVFLRDMLTGMIQRVSISSMGAESNGPSGHTSMSLDGTYVMFSSDASNLVPGDTNAASDVFVHDRISGVTSRVSVSSAGTQGNGDSFNYMHAISEDGRYVVFHSDADDLVVGDTNGVTDVFLHDRTLGTTNRISVDSSGTQANGPSFLSTISVINGRFFAFQSKATNLVSGDTNGVSDVFVHDRSTGQTIRVSINSTGGQGDDVSHRASISGDGQSVVFASLSTNLDPGTTFTNNLFNHNITTGATVQITPSWSGSTITADRKPSKSSGGIHVAFKSDADNLVPGDTNGANDIFVYDEIAGTTIRASLSASSSQGNGPSDHQAISSDGRFVSFSSKATNMVPGDTNGFQDIFLRDVQAGTTVLVSECNSSSIGPLGGRIVADDEIHVETSAVSISLTVGLMVLAAMRVRHRRS